MLNRTTRRALLRVAPLAAPLLIAACNGQNPLQNNVTVDFSTAQQWSNTITNAMHAFYTEAVAALGAKLPADIADIANKADATLGAVNAQVQAATSGSSSVLSLINQIIAAVTSLAGALAPIFAPVAAAMPEIGIALAVLTAFVNSLAMVVPAVPSKLRAAAARAPAR